MRREQEAFVLRGVGPITSRLFGREGIKVRDRIWLVYYEVDATLEDNKTAYQFTAERAKQAKKCTIVTDLEDETAIINAPEFTSVLEQTVEKGRPVIEIFTGPQEKLKERLESQSLIQQALRKGNLRINVVPSKIAIPHFCLIDDKEQLLERVHNSGQPRQMWYLEKGAGLLALKRRLESWRLRRSATPIEI